MRFLIQENPVKEVSCLVA